LRRQRLSGPAIARQLAMPVSTVGGILRRLGLGKLAALEPRPPIVRYQRERPRELLHIDTKKLRRIEALAQRPPATRLGQPTFLGSTGSTVPPSRPAGPLTLQGERPILNILPNAFGEKAIVKLDPRRHDPRRRSLAGPARHRFRTQSAEGSQTLAVFLTSLSCG
jgi:hypothetical protein